MEPQNLFDVIFTWTKFLTLGIFVLIVVLLFIKNVKNMINLIFRPYSYFENNHSKILKEIINKEFGTKIDNLIKTTVFKASHELVLPTDKWRSVIDTTVIETLDEAGIKKCINENKSFRLDLNKRLSAPYAVDPDYKKSLIELIKENSKKVKASIGKKSKSTYQYYIDLRQVLPNGEIAMQLNNILINFISDYNNEARPGFDFVAVNRNSNTIFGYLISNLLGIPLMIVNYDSSRWLVDGKEVKIDGLNAIKKPYVKRKGFVIDDAVSGGSVLKESVEVLKRKGFILDDVFVLFSRKEDAAIDEFLADGITLHSIFNLDDNDIKKILNTENKDLEFLVNEL